MSLKRRSFAPTSVARCLGALRHGHGAEGTAERAGAEGRPVWARRWVAREDLRGRPGWHVASFPPTPV